MPAVTPLDPIPESDAAPIEPSDSGARRVGLQLVAGAVVLAATVLLAIQPGGPTAIQTTVTEPPMVDVARSGAPNSLSLIRMYCPMPFVSPFKNGISNRFRSGPNNRS